MSRLIEFAQEIDKELENLRCEATVIGNKVFDLEEKLAKEKEKNRLIALMLREMANRIEREEI